LRGGLLISHLVGLDMRAECSVPDRGRVDVVVFGIEQVETNSVASKTIRAPETNIDTERFPTIDNGWPERHTINAARREEELPQERVERAYKPRMQECAFQADSMAPDYEFLDRGVRKGEDG
jgi:hypothetical protein